MRTLYLRNVPDEVAARLEEIAKDEGISMNAAAITILTNGTAWKGNKALLDRLPDLGTSSEDIVRSLHEGRAER